MSSEKMGIFISELRKSQQMTQKELADKLNVTDKAVSKWERGLSYPDISLLIPISDILGITAGELLNGERIPDTASKAETNATIGNVLQYADEAVKHKTKHTKRRALVVALTGAALLWCLLMLPLIIWPNIAARANNNARNRMIMSQFAEVALLEQEVIDEHFRRAEEYNASLSMLSMYERLSLGRTQAWDYTWNDYTSILNIGGIMGRVEVPTASIDLPIFHGTNSMALERGAGHMEGTDFPIGGYDNHSVIVAHAGFRHSRMFREIYRYTDIGDYFYVTVLDRRMVYRIFETKRIEPWEVDLLAVEPGNDVVTLMTCTPYRINSHRMLVRGIRVS